MDTNELNTGDRVITLNNGGYDDIKAGMKGTVVYVVNDRLVEVRLDDSNYCEDLAFYVVEEIKKIEEPDPEAAIQDLFDSLPETTAPEVDDHVVKPAHYAKWPIEPITFIMRNGFEFWRGNIVKYASRAGSKLYTGMDEVQSEITDLQKVIRYAEMRINQLNGEVEL